MAWGLCDDGILVLNGRPHNVHDVWGAFYCGDNYVRDGHGERAHADRRRADGLVHLLEHVAQQRRRLLRRGRAALARGENSPVDERDKRLKPRLLRGFCEAEQPD